MNKQNIDVNAVLVKPIFFGLTMNILFPIAILAAIYFITNPNLQASPLQNQNLTTIFWLLGTVSIINGALAIFLKQKMFFAPMISSKETFEQDLTRRFFVNSIICYALTTAITIYGLVFYFLGGTFHQLFLFILISFIAFQVVRPRHRFLEKVVAAQEKLVDEGRFCGSQK